MLMFNNLIDGEWMSDGARSPNVNPSDTNDVVGEAVRGTRAQADAAIAAAKAAFPGLVALDAAGPLRHPEKGLRRNSGAQGRTRPTAVARGRQDACPRAIGEAARAGQIFAFFAGECLRMAGEKLASVRPGIDVEVTREAVGVVGLITPWNFPIAIPAWKIAPALAYGNTVVIKPADLVPGSTWALVDILHRAGLPKGVLNLVIGRGSEVGAAIARASRRRRDQLHRLGRDRAEGRRRLRRLAADEEIPARDGRQEPARRSRRRRPQGRGGMRGQQRVLLHRPALHGGVAADRHQGHPRQVRRRAHRAPERAEDRRRPEGRHRYRPGGRSGPARSGSEISRRSARTRARSSPSAASG